MSFDTKITMTWASAADADNATINEQRIQLVNTMTGEGKTNGTVTVVSPVVFERFFIDVPAAEEWQTGLTAICNTNSIPAPSFVIV